MKPTEEKLYRQALEQAQKLPEHKREDTINLVHETRKIIEEMLSRKDD